MTWHKIGGRLSALLAATVAALLVAEVTARVVFLPRMSDAVALPDEALLYGPHPGSRKVYERRDQERRVVTRINSDGFRGPELLSQAEPRIALYGDSMLMGIEVDYPDTFGEHMRRLLHDQGVEAEVVNAALLGYGPDQALLRFEREVEQLRPDIVILGICTHNDFGDLIRNRIAHLTREGGIETRTVTLHAAYYAHFQEEQAQRRLPTLWRAYLEYSRPRAKRKPPLTSEKYFARQERALTMQLREYRKDDTEVVPSFSDDYDLDMAVGEDAPGRSLKLRLMGGLLARFQEACEQRDIDLVLLLLPSPVDVMGTYSLQVDTERYPTYTRRGIIDNYLTIARALDLTIIDLFGPFQEAGAEKLFLPGQDIHWNEEGHRLAAEVAAEQLQASSYSSETGR